MSVNLELFCLMTQNLPKMSNLIGFIDSRSKHLLWLEKSVKKIRFYSNWAFLAVFCDFLRFHIFCFLDMFFNSSKMVAIHGSQKQLIIWNIDLERIWVHLGTCIQYYMTYNGIFVTNLLIGPVLSKYGSIWVCGRKVY